MKSTPYWTPSRSAPGTSRTTAFIAPAVIAIASKSRWSCSNVMSTPIAVSNTNLTPSRSMRRTSISIASRGRRNAGTPMSIVPPAYGRLSKTVTSKPFSASSRATDSPAGPAPTTATRSARGVDGRHDVRDPRGLVPLDEEPLHRPDRERPVDVAAAAGPLARGRADVRAHRRDRVRLAGQDVALLEPTLGGEVEVAPTVRTDRARFLALDVALEPGGVDGLDEEFLVRVDGQGAVVPFGVELGAGGTDARGTPARRIYHRPFRLRKGRALARERSRVDVTRPSAATLGSRKHAVAGHRRTSAQGGLQS